MNIEQLAIAIMADNHRPKLRPYLQGNLDSLCGVYALINGIRWALRNELVSAKGEHWEELFRKLTDHAIKSRGHLELVNDGLSLYGMIALTHVAQDHMREYHNIGVVMRRPFALRRPLEAMESVNTISDHLAQSNTAVLAAVYGTLNHWCVIKQLDEQRAHLFDSDRQSHLAISAFQPAGFIDPKRRRTHVQPGSIILLEFALRIDV
ncbi:hypothetical protein [Ochrobactrum sp. CGA5]|uniref:hypothetical protein n=1 Tax=Ochrobactrum sp. CGA5 TaxID=2583453 RepID=UPI0011212986|nr:hypothetical protein [Ochrobactrum sp. CGA5]